MKKKFNPQEGIEQVPYERQMVEFIDNLILFARKNGSSNQVKTSMDWKTLDFLYKGWAALYPKSASDFEIHMKEIQSVSKHGIARDKGGAMIQHQLEIPSPLYRMMRVIFPDQKWDRPFVRKFSQHFPMMRGGKSL
jgi:hypothetical protein